MKNVWKVKYFLVELLLSVYNRCVYRRDLIGEALGVFSDSFCFVWVLLVCLGFIRIGSDWLG